MNTLVNFGSAQPSQTGQFSFGRNTIHIMTSEIGGSNDIVARLLAQGIAGPLGQPVIVDNRGSKLIGPLGAKAAPDGYTLVIGSSTFILGPLLQKEAYDPVRDFTPITIAARAPNVLIVHPSLPVKSVKDLIALAKARPGELNYASAGTGSAAHLAGELFNSVANVKTVRINYKGTGPALIAIVAGEVHVMVATGGALVPNIQSGRVRALAVTTPEPSALFPGLPAVAETLPGYEITIMGGVLAPAGTPAPIINRLNQEMVRVLNQPDVRDKLFKTGVETGGISPEAFGNMIKSEIARMGKVIKDAGIRED